jgi:DNA-binding NarL/FixJ family response regulator
MSRHHLGLFTGMSPARFVPFDGMHGVCALARDENLRLVWCNEAYATACGRRSEELLGTTPHDVHPHELAEQRAERMRRVLHGGVTVSFYQFWRGLRWHTRIWPLEPCELAREGCFIAMTPAVTAEAEEPDRSPAVLIYQPDLGDLAVLSPRELEVFYYLASGMTVGETAATLHRSPKTVSRHAERINQKLGYRNRAELVTDAVRRGVVAFSPDDWRAMVEST